MKKTALLKTSLREIKNSPARFLSILGIIFLGVAFFVGIGATGPDMIRLADNYYKETQLADMSIYSSLGFSTEDQAILLKDKNIKEANLQYLLDLHLSQKNSVFRFFSIGDDETLNQLRLVSGKHPDASNEILLDSHLYETEEYKIGDTFEILAKDDPEDQLKEHTFKVVGFVQSPEFIDNSKRGNTNAGNGSIASFAYLPAETFQMTAYGRLLLSFKNVQNEVAYSQSYLDLMEENEKKVTTLLAPRKQGRLKEIRTKAMKELNENQQKITEAKNQINEGEDQLAEALKKLEAGEKELKTGQATFQSEMAKAEAEISSQSSQLKAAQNELNQQRDYLDEQQRELDRNSGELSAYEEQMNQILAQQETIEATLAQLEEAQVIYDDLIVIMDQMAGMSEAQQREAIESIKASLFLLSLTLPESAEMNDLIEMLIAEITFENFATTENGIRQMGALIAQQLVEIQSGLDELASQKQALEAGRQALEEGQAQLDVGRLALSEGQKKLNTGLEQLNQGKQTLALERERGQVKLDAGKLELAQGQASYKKEAMAFAKLRDEKLPELEAAQKKLNKEQEKLAALKPATFTLLTRENNAGYLEYEENANRISSIATVFPTIFFLIAALVSLTTMGRMIEEKRTEIGTYKALGYKNSEVSQKFLIYSLAAGLTGTLLGLIVGFYLFPTIIINAYGQLYSMTDFSTPWYLSYSLIALAVGLFCTVGISMIVLRVDLMSTPAILLRPKAPKAGKTILLERMKPIWRRLNFNQKVTMRNLFRYKARMFMTIFGIAGCTAMILTGFGLKNSIGDIVPIQFNEVWRYQGIVSFDQDATAEQQKEYQEKIEQLAGLKANLGIASENLTLTQSGKNSQEVTIYVPEDLTLLSEFVSFTDRKTREVFELDDQGALVNEKLANLFELSIGDTIELKNADNEPFKVKISGIVENYVGHFAYLSPKYYTEVFGRTPSYNSELLLFKENLTKEEEKNIANELMKLKPVLNVSFLSDSSTALDDTTEILNVVVWVLIISAGLLAFIVLYNLNNINISERIRELSTIKVLGFYNKEVTMYIYRENILLTIFGVIAGLFLGRILHSYVLTTVELDMLMFSPKIHSLSYVYSSIITVFFTIVVGFVMYQKLKKVDMIEALKSND